MIRKQHLEEECQHQVKANEVQLNAVRLRTDPQAVNQV